MIKRVIFLCFGFLSGLAVCWGLFRSYEQRAITSLVETPSVVSVGALPLMIPDLDAVSHHEEGVSLREGTADELPNNRLAFSHFLAAAKKGHVKSMVAVGNFYHLGTVGAAADPVAAQAWWNRAADKGDAEANFLLSIHKTDGY